MPYPSHTRITDMPPLPSTGGCPVTTVGHSQLNFMARQLLLLLATASWAAVATSAAAGGATSTSPTIQKVLMSIEEKLRSLDSLGHTMRFSGLHYGMDQMSRRMDALEVRLSHLESKLEARLDKISEAVTCHDARDRSLIEHVNRRMDTVLQKTTMKLGALGTALNVHTDRLQAKVEAVERNILGAVDSAVIKTSERPAVMAHVDESRTPLQQQQQQLLREELAEAVSRRIENSSKFLILEEHLLRAVDALSEAVANHSAACKEEPDDDDDDVHLQEDFADLEPADTPFVPERWNSAVHGSNGSEMLFVVGDKRLHELDSDIEIYTRKVMSTYQELFKETKSIDGSLREVLDQGNGTRFILREGLRKLYQQLKPFSDLDQQLQSLLKKMIELGATVDTTFASLLVAQNTFITTCHRVQQQEPVIETKIYHLLQKLVQEIEKRSSAHNEDCSLKQAFDSHRKDVGQALHDLVWTVITVGNQTVEDLRQQMTPQVRVEDANCSRVVARDELHVQTEEPHEMEEEHVQMEELHVQEKKEDEELHVQEEEEEEVKHVLRADVVQNTQMRVGVEEDTKPEEDGPRLRYGGVDVIPEQLFDANEDVIEDEERWADAQSSGSHQMDYDYS